MEPDLVEARRLNPQWDGGLIAASIAVSLLGAFTSTQLICQARMSLRFTSIAAWTALGSLTFGFCSIWCLHFVAMLACKLDLRIGINVGLTILSAILAVCFTFLALASDLLCERYRTYTRRRRRAERMRSIYKDTPQEQEVSELLLPTEPETESHASEEAPTDGQTTLAESIHEMNGHASESQGDRSSRSERPYRSVSNSSMQASRHRNSSADSVTSGSTGRSGSFSGASHSSTGLRDILNIARQTTVPAKNAFISTGERLYAGCTTKNLIKGLLWSLAITSMHYVGIIALRVPQGYVTFNPFLVLLSAIISWVVCVVGCILMSQIETRLTSQLLLSVVASTGVAAMHFTGKPEKRT